MRSIKKELLEAGLGRAMNELKVGVIPCSNQHGAMRARQGFNFCPRCGVELSIKITCEQCQRKFISLKAYRTHISEHRPVCPKCKSTRNVYNSRGFVPDKRTALNRDELRKLMKLPRYFCAACDTTFAWRFEEGKGEVMKSQY